MFLGSEFSGRSAAELADLIKNHMTDEIREKYAEPEEDD